MSNDVIDYKAPPAKRLINLAIEEVSLVPEGANQLAHMCLFKSKRPIAMTDKVKVNEAQVEKPEVAKAIEQPKAVEPKVETSTNVNRDDMQKTVDSLAKQHAAEIEKAASEIQKLRAENAAAVARVQALEDVAKKAEIKKKVEATKAAFDMDKAADIIHRAPEASDLILELLSQLAKLQDYLMRSQGSAAVATQPEAVEGTIMGKIKKMVDERRALSPSLSVHQIEAEIWRSYPELYVEYENALEGSN